jgi:hypothetical protein
VDSKPVEETAYEGLPPSDSDRLLPCLTPASKPDKLETSDVPASDTSPPEEIPPADLSPVVEDIQEDLKPVEEASAEEPSIQPLSKIASQRQRRRQELRLRRALYPSLLPSTYSSLFHLMINSVGL